MCSYSMASAHVIFEVNQTKGGCQLGRKVVHHNYKNDLTLTFLKGTMFFAHFAKSKFVPVFTKG